jgi:hypothetical protein
MRRLLPQCCIAAAAMLLAACQVPVTDDADGTAESDVAGVPEWPEGTFGNVELSEESGDLGGFEVRFYAEEGRHMAEFVLCEGWCNRSFQVEVHREDGGFVFEHVEEFPGWDGNESHLVRYLLIPQGDGMRLQSWYDGEELSWEEFDHLPRISEPFGLEVASSNLQ